MVKAHVLTPWESDGAGNRPTLLAVLGPGDSCMDVTGQAAENITPDPNLATWEVWSAQASTMETLASDGRFYVLAEWEEEV